MTTTISLPNELVPHLVDALRNHADRLEASADRLWPDELEAVRLMRHYVTTLGTP